MVSTQAVAASRSVVLELDGLQWASARSAVEATLGRRPGVLAVTANPAAQTATVAFDPTVTDVPELASWIRQCGLHCRGESVPDHLCATPVTARAGASASAAPRSGDRRSPDPAATGTGSHGAKVDHAASAPAQHVPVSGHDMASMGGSPTTTPDRLGSPADVMGHGGHGEMSMAGMVRDMRNRFFVAAVFGILITLWSRIGREVLHFTVAAPFGLRDDVFQLMSLPVIFCSAQVFFAGAVQALKARTLDMMVAVGAGWVYSVGVTLTGGSDVFYEAATILTAMVLLGHYFEMRARGGANEAVRALLQLAPPVAVVLREASRSRSRPTRSSSGTCWWCGPGSKIAADGLVEDGERDLNESTATGESLPVHKAIGNQVVGATVNTTGTLRVRATRVGADTALAQIVKLVQAAQNSKAPGQRLADRAAFWLVLVALAGGAGTFVVWLLAGRPVSQALLFAITVVVLTCPDALGLATPTAIMVGTGLGAKPGVLFKTATAVETSKKIDIVVMDKTGTLTLGAPEVTDLVVAGLEEPEVLALVAAVERKSEHPLARAVVARAQAAGVRRLDATDFRNVPGQGATARSTGIVSRSATAG